MKNVSSYPGIFHIYQPEKRDVFKVEWKVPANGRQNLLVPGMSLHLKLYFNCQSLDDIEDSLIILVEGGQKSVIKISANREVPILKSKYP